MVEMVNPLTLIGVFMNITTYDILNVGTNNRFFVRAKDGTPMCVHNCGYGMGKDRFEERLTQVGLSDVVPMADMIIKKYRAKNYMTKSFWDTCQNALEVMAQGGQMWFGGSNNDLFFADGSSNFFGEIIPSIRFPNGTWLFYKNLRKEPSTDSHTGFEFVYDMMDEGRVTQKRIYGGKLCENIIQKFAFDILKFQAVKIMDCGVPIVLNVHDEWVSIVPKDRLKEAVAIHAHCMRQTPDYFPAGLLDCEVDVGKNYADTHTINGI